uniref:Uncharacterized protein n=1 Tax=Arundo donax TaxID=35708 RepID=A0A0A9FJV9_ARUDO
MLWHRSQIGYLLKGSVISCHLNLRTHLIWVQFDLLPGLFLIIYSVHLIIISPVQRSF